MTDAAPGDDGTASFAGGSSGVELYIYYRVPTARAAAAAAVARACQRRACAAHPGLTARLLRRDEAGDGAQQTWMEIYRHSSAAVATTVGIDAALQAAIEAHALPLAGFIDGTRHIERFTACA